MYSKQLIPKPLRTFVLERDNFSCRYCGARENLTMDHVHPECLGGDTTKENLVACCSPCNLLKGKKPLKDWERGKQLISEWLLDINQRPRLEEHLAKIKP